MWNRIKLYIISLWLLFLLIIIKEFDYEIWDHTKDYEFNFKLLASKNILSMVSFTLLVLGIFLLFNMRRKVTGTLNLPKKIKKIKNLNYEHLTFLTTYIIPFICFDLDDARNTVIFVFLLLVIGAIYIKTNLFYANPTLALLGYHIYQVDTATESEMVLITQGKLENGDSFSDIDLGEAIYYAKFKQNPRIDE